ncbi:hypothetical protein NK983_23775, partial [Salmonella enterica subsp. enterica serovar Typhimurium]|nr:hypothetical protein [Salmonella enterica subsp. enterica serovar Typhimurium]
EGNGQITARLGESSVTSQFSVVGRTPTVVAVKPITSSIAVDAVQTLSVHLSEAASAATTVALSASPAGLLTLPASLVVPAGAGEASFQVSGRSAGTATVRAGLNDSSAEAAVHVVSPPARVQALEPPRADLIVGAATRVTLRLNSAQLESIEVALVVIPAGIASTPARVVVPAGQMQAAFDLQALTAGSGTLRATLNGESVQSSIVVVPPA